MAIAKLITDLNNVQGLDDEPNDVTGLTAVELKALFDKAPNDIKTYINSLIDILNSTVSGSSGSENISSANIPGLIGNTVYAQIVNLLSQVLTLTNTTAFTPTAQYHPATKKYVDDTAIGVVLGQIPDRSLPNTKIQLGTLTQYELQDTLQNNFRWGAI